MKVCLISPPTLSEFNERQVARSEGHRLISEHAPMGILSLAAVLDKSGIIPQVVDLNRLNFSYFEDVRRQKDVGSFADYVIDFLKDKRFDVFGFSTICSTYPLTIRLAELVKSLHPDSKIVFGGPQASVVDVQTLNAFPFIDFVVRGEAEETLPLLLDKIGDSSSLTDNYVSGITFRQGSKITRFPNAAPIADLDSLPMPAFHLYPYIESCRYAPLEAGRGCPFACSFCSTNDFFRRRFRMKSPEVLVKQMEFIKSTYGIENFDLIHDMFTVDRRKVIGFCNAIEKSGKEFSWTCSARTDCVDSELIAQMARAGCTGLYFGVDSGSQNIQASIDKGLNMKEAAVHIKQAAMQRIDTTVSLITGFPDETREDLLDTVKFAGDVLRYPPVDIQLHLLAPLAETPITTRFKEELIYDEIFSDMSLQGWEQYPQDRKLIVANPDIFTNFYTIPTRWLDRHYLKEFREFLLKGVARHRWLFVLLHQDCGDLLRVFDAWRLWSRTGNSVTTRDRHFYASHLFSEDLLAFAYSHYAERMSTHPHLIRTMTNVESALLTYQDACHNDISRRNRKRPSRLESLSNYVPRLSQGVKLVEVEANYKKLIRCLQTRRRYDRIPAEPQTVALLPSRAVIRVLQLNRLAAQLLSFCNGESSVKEIAHTFCGTTSIEGVPSEQATLYGILCLAKQGLIDIHPQSA